MWDNIGLLLVAGVLATLTYYFFENPIRHSRFLARRRWASLLMGLCLIAATLAVTTYEQNRPTVNLGVLTTVTPGSTCPTRRPASCRACGRAIRWTSGGATHGDPELVCRLIGDSTACTLLLGLDAVGPSYGMRFEDGAVVGCGMVSGVIAPLYVDGKYNVRLYRPVSGGSHLAETQVIERYRPSLIVWASTEEHNSIVAKTATGSKVLEAGSPSGNR